VRDVQEQLALALTQVSCHTTHVASGGCDASHFTFGSNIVR